MVDAIANLSLEILRDLLVEETKFLLNVGGEVERVKRDLKRIHAMLKKADRERSASPTLKVYVAELKDLAFEAETVLETYAVLVESKREGKRSLKEKLQRYICIMCECSTLHEVGKEVGDIISRLSDLTDKLQSEFAQQFPPLSGRKEDLLRQTYPHEVEPHFVGMKKDMDYLVSMMMDVRTRRRVIIKIYGMGGLGKTTLARRIYNHADVKPHARAWVCVTQHFQHKAVLSTILKTLENNEDRNKEIDGKEVDDLKAGIHSFAEQRKCLIVIDDIWENDHWDIIKKALPINCNVLLTTRNQNIANVESIPHKLDFLTEDEGWDLLHKIALPRYPQPELLEDIGRKIVEKCGRLPLSISVIGGILRQKEEDGLEVEWKKICENMDLYLSKGEGVGENKTVKEVLELSYDALPYYLKPCFLYLAFFPNDKELDTERLYLLWIAEGFILHQDKWQTETLRDVAERYLTELGMRCMVEVHKTKAYSPYKKFDSCGLHDLMQELCLSKAQEENFLKPIEIPTSSIDNYMISRLAIIHDVQTLGIPLPRLEKVKDLRSFMLLTKVRYPNERKMIFKDIGFNLESSRHLRVLMLEKCEFEGEMLPRKVRELIHLRYLSLEFSRVRELPEFVCGMPYLQTLDLQVSNSTCGIRLPNVIWKMKKLKHLFLPLEIEVIGGDKLRLDGLYELETLQHVKSEKVCMIDIPKLISLRKLSVTVDDEDSLSIVLQHMIILSIMSEDKSRSCETILFVKSCTDLSSERGKDIFKNVLMSPSLVMLHITGCNFSGGFPCYELGMCSNLVHMELDDCKVGVEVGVMRELGNYPILQSLTLNQVDFAHTETLICPSNSFPQLDFLILRGLSNIKKWEVEKSAMQKLTKLCLHSCNKLRHLPSGDAHKGLSNLQYVHIRDCPELRNIDSEWRKFPHLISTYDWVKGSPPASSLPAVETQKENVAATEKNPGTETLTKDSSSNLHEVIPTISAADSNSSSISERKIEQQFAVEIADPSILESKMSVSALDSQQRVESESHGEIQPAEITTVRDPEKNSVKLQERVVSSTAERSDIETVRFKEEQLYSVVEKNNHLQLILDDQVISIGDYPSPSTSGVNDMLNLVGQDLQELSEESNYTDSLMILLLQRNKRLAHIHPSFFNAVPELHFLDISDTKIRILPSSLFKLSKLKVLLLRNCLCLETLPPEIGNLIHLEVLDLSGSELYELPDEIGQLEHVRNMQLSFYGPDDESEYEHLPSRLVSPTFLSKLDEMEALSIIVHPEDHRWTETAARIIQDMSKLDKLSYLQFYFPVVEMFENFIEMSPSWKEKSLVKFDFTLGQDVKRISSRVPDEVELLFSQHERCLRYVDGDMASPLLKSVLTRVTSFYLDHHTQVQSLSEFDISNFNELKFCIVRECPKIHAIVDEKSAIVAFARLEYLGIFLLWELEHIWMPVSQGWRMKRIFKTHTPLTSKSFEALRHLIIKRCPKLQFILWESMLLCLANLEELVVEDCEKVEKIIKGENYKVKYKNNVLSRLRKLVLRDLPELVTLGNGVRLSKEEISILGCPKLILKSQDFSPES